MTTNKENIRKSTLETIAKLQEHSITCVNSVLGGKREELTELVEENYSTLVRVISALKDKDASSMVNVQSLAKIFDDIAASIVDVYMDDDKVKQVSNTYSEMETYLTEMLIYPSRTVDWENKTSVLHCLIRENTRNSIFSCEELYLVIHRVNNEWDDLIRRGFSENLIKKFSSSCAYYQEHGSSFNKYSVFMNLLDGRAKLVPTYAEMFEFYKVESEKDIITQIDLKNKKDKNTVFMQKKKSKK